MAEDKVMKLYESYWLVWFEFNNQAHQTLRTSRIGAELDHDIEENDQNTNDFTHSNPAYWVRDDER